MKRRFHWVKGQGVVEVGAETKSGSQQMEIVSDELGFGEYQLNDFEKDRTANGFSGIEFTRDPMVPQFIQVRCKSRSEFEKYAAHRGLPNRTSTLGAGAMITASDLEKAAARAKEMYPEKKS